jgi:hypothetical protein
MSYLAAAQANFFDCRHAPRYEVKADQLTCSALEATGAEVLVESTSKAIQEAIRIVAKGQALLTS